MDEFLRSIPAAASSPYAFVAYAISAILFLFAGSRLRMTRMLLGKIQAVPEHERRRALEIASGTMLPTEISAEQWIRNNRLRWAFLLIAAFLIAVLTVGTLAILRVKEEAGKGLVFVRGTVTHGDNDIPALDVTLRNDSQKVAVITSAHINVLDRWHIGPTWIQPEALPVSYTYDVKLPGEKGGVVDVNLSQELRPQTADRFVLRFGPGEGDESAWYPAVGLFIYVLQIELRYNEQNKSIELPVVFTNIPPPREMAASFNPGASDSQLKTLLSDAITAKKEIPPNGITDESTVKKLDSWIDSLQKAVAKRSGQR